MSTVGDASTAYGFQRVCGLGSKSKRGTEVAALYYSLIESAKLAGKDPAVYLRAAVEAMLWDGTVLLPHQMS